MKSTKCLKARVRLCGVAKRAIALVMFQLFGWFIFTYVEEDIILTDCWTNGEKVTKQVNEHLKNHTTKEIDLCSNTSLKYLLKSNVTCKTFNRKLAMIYAMFNPAPTKKSDNFACYKWFPFVVATLTTIGEKITSCLFLAVSRHKSTGQKPPERNLPVPKPPRQIYLRVKCEIPSTLLEKISLPF